MDLHEGDIAALVAALGPEFDVDERALREAVLDRWASRVGIVDLLDRARTEARQA